MTLRLTTASLVLTITTLTMTGGVHAITMEECYEKYQAAKQARTLKGKTWIDFRKVDCGSPAPTPESASTMTAPKAEKKEATRPAAPPAAAPLGSAIIPSAVASNSSKVREGKSADFTGAWTTDASACNKVFVKSGARIAFAKRLRTHRRRPDLSRKRHSGDRGKLPDKDDERRRRSDPHGPRVRDHSHAVRRKNQFQKREGR